MIYVSLVGTQVMAVLNPLLSWMTHGSEKLAGVRLLATEESWGKAETIMGFLRKDLFEEHRIQLVPISDSMETDDRHRPPAHEGVAAFTGEEVEIAFNLAGGMNFQIAACLAALPIEKAWLLYPESEGVHAVRVRNGIVSDHRKLPLPPPEDVLQLQGIPHEVRDKSFSEFLGFALGECKIQLPKKRETNLRIENVDFDIVWNVGNELRFLKVIHNPGAENRRPGEDILREARQLMSLASDRPAFGELYHRDIAVLTNHSPSAERIQSEGGGKVMVIHQYENDFCPKLRRFLRSSPPEPSIGETITVDAGESGKTGGSVLYTVLAPNVMPTLIALWSHAPEKTCLLYTPGDPQVEMLKDAILAEKNALPTRKLSFIPVSIDGTELLTMEKPDDSENTVVNFTPGTKGQTAFLTLWARMNGLCIYSLRTDDQSLRRIPDFYAGDLKAPSPPACLRMQGASLRSVGEDKKDLLRDQEGLDAMLGLLRVMAEKNRVPSTLPWGPVELMPDARLFSKNKKSPVKVWVKGMKTTVDLPIELNGAWAERLIGYALLKCGADEVQVRMRTRWSETMEAELGKRGISSKNHRTDMDAVARFGADYFLIESKAMGTDVEGNQPEDIALRTEAVSRLFGRFGVPLVCYLHYDGEPFLVNRVNIFGYRTLSNINALKALLQKAIGERRKTRR